MEWLVASDQPFQEVERPQFRSLLEYVHHRAEELDVPSSSTMQRRVMKMGDDLKKELCLLCGEWLLRSHFSHMLSDVSQSLQGKVSISLDAWTSSNGYAFLAIVAHYINNDGSWVRTSNCRYVALCLWS